MATVHVETPTEEIEYPTSDGKPMAETEVHRQNMSDTIDELKGWFAEVRDTYVSGNMLMFYVPGDKRKHVSPDVFVVHGIPKHIRDNYLVWVEGKGPDAIIELTSRSTAEEDMEFKFWLYCHVLKAREYFLFDPHGEYLVPALQGYRLIEGQYARIEPVEGRLPSEVLGLHLEKHEWQLRLYDPANKQWLPTPDELQVENQRLRKELEALRGEAPKS